MDKPVVWLTLAYAVGILLASLLPIPIASTIILLLVFILLTTYASCHKLNTTIFLLIILLLLGCFLYQYKNLPNPKDIAQYADKGYGTVTGRIDEQPKISEKGAYFPLKTEQVGTSDAVGRLNVFTTERLTLEYGDRVVVRGVIEADEGLANPFLLRPRRSFKLFASYVERLPGGGGNPLKKLAIFLSGRFNDVLNKILPKKDASLLGSILLGSAVSPLDSSVTEQYRKAGLIHLLVVSGTQVSILIGVCLGLMRGSGLPLTWSVLATSFFNLMLVIITGAGASIIRAAIMGEVMLVGLLFDREKEFYTALAISALLLLLLDPNVLFDIGFQLSFAATWSLVYVVPVMEKRMPQLLALSISPLLATTPIIATCFGQITPGAIISNLLVLPWVEFLVILGFGTTVLGFILLPVAQVLGHTIWLLLLCLENIADLVASLPGTSIYIAVPGWPVILGYYLALLALLELLKREEKLRLTPKRIMAGVLFLLVVFLWNGLTADTASGQLVVTFLDVGQGDSIFIQTPQNKLILIDGGGEEKAQGGHDKVGQRVVLPFLRRQGITRLDLVIATHPHNDHIGGLNEVLAGIKVDQVIDNGQVFDSAAYRRFKGLLKANAIKCLSAKVGQRLELGDELRGTIIGPFQPLTGDVNSDSIVLRLVYGKISFLFTGDLEQAGEERLLRSTNHELRSTILKVGHHGSRTSTSDEFLRRVAPELAVILVGKNNRYRHPHQSTLERLIGSGIKYLRTDLDGAITVRTDGRSYTIDRQRRSRSPNTPRPSSGYSARGRGPRTLRRG
ncbi:MAG: DNA internalization-related competence protein ComEC/Rec2 [Candidatus Margulisiibacteriota bacterium]